jgi:hypothetical protein
MLEFMNSMNQDHKFGKDNKVRQDKWSSSLPRKVLGLLVQHQIDRSIYAKYFIEFGKGKKVKEIVLGMNNHYDVQNLWRTIRSLKRLTFVRLCIGVVE